MIPMVPDTELNEGCGKNYSSLGSGQGRLPGGGGGWAVNWRRRVNQKKENRIHFSRSYSTCRGLEPGECGFLEELKVIPTDWSSEREKGELEKRHVTLGPLMRSEVMENHWALFWHHESSKQGSEWPRCCPAPKFRSSKAFAGYCVQASWGAWTYPGAAT